MDETDRNLILPPCVMMRARRFRIWPRCWMCRARRCARASNGCSSAGEIVGFTVVLRGDAARDPVRGLMMIGIEGRGTERIIRQIKGCSAVRAVHTTNGRWDVIVEIGTDTLEAFDVILGQIRKFDGIASSETSLLLNTRKSGG